MVNMMNKYDFIVIGAGVIGSAIARELARYTKSDGSKFEIAVLEKNLDVCCETSGRNSGVLHAGFNNQPGSRMARFCVEGNQTFDRVAEELAVPFKRTGKVVVGFDEEDRRRIYDLIDRGHKNGISQLRFIEKGELRSIAPYIEGEFAMYSPTTAILDPFQLTIGLAENAYDNGVDYYFDAKVVRISRVDSGYEIGTTNGNYYTKWIINSAGLGADHISNMMGIKDYTIYPCRGEYFILDKHVGQFLQIPAYPVPNPKEGGLGIHLTPTIDGNVMIGPSADYIDERDDYSATRKVMDVLLAGGRKIFPHIENGCWIRNFTGIRPKLVDKTKGGYADFVMEIRPEVPCFVNLVGMESPGLTSSTPIAKEVIRMLSEYMDFKENQNFNPCRTRKTRFWELPVEEKKKLIDSDSAYGEVICRCENITRAEILAAIHNPLGVHTVSGVKVRCRAMMGRCQGGYCQPQIIELMEQELGMKRADIRYNRRNAYMFTGKVRE